MVSQKGSEGDFSKTNFDKCCSEDFGSYEVAVKKLKD